MKEIYLQLKQTYKNYIILIKQGNFYIVINKDANIIHNIFKYKIVESKDFIKFGFPVQTINKIKDKLNSLNINYIILENNEIVEKQKFKKNNINNYISNDNYELLFSRINNISDKLKKNINSINIKDILNEIESIIWKINY